MQTLGSTVPLASGASGCSTYDDDLLHYSAFDGPKTGVAAGSAGVAGAAGAPGGEGGGAGLGGDAGDAGEAGTAGMAGVSGSGGNAGESGGNAGDSGASAGDGGASGVGGDGGSAAVCTRVTIPPRPVDDGGSVSMGPNAAGAAGTNTGGAAGTNTGGAAGTNTGGAAGSGGANAGASGQAGKAGTGGGSGSAAGQGGSAAGQGGSAAGQGGSAAGQGGSAAGQGGSAAGQGGSAAGGTGPQAGQAGQTGTDDPVLTFAVRTLDFGEKDSPETSTIGFDVDGSCTCTDTQVETCVPPTPRAPLCDGPGGRDNSFPRLLKQLVAFSIADSSEASTASLEKGEYSLLLSLQHYNGLPDDPDVTFSLVIGGEATAPKWDGSDSWTVLSSSVFDDDVARPRILDTTAYVTNGQLVASIPTFDANDEKVVLQLNHTFAVALTGAVVVAKIESFLGKYQLTEGTLSGRWRDKDFFQYFSTYRPAFAAGSSVCTDSPLYPSVKGGFCGFADVSDSLSSVTATCTAMTIATRFTAVEAKLGEIEPVPPAKPSSCPAATNPATDSCSK
jgi:hypothetical protein